MCTQILLSLRRAISLCLLTLLIALGTSLAGLGPSTMAAHASSSELRLKTCISHPIVSGNLTLNICTSKTHYESGEIVKIFYLLRNVGPVSLEMSSITDGVFVTDPNGKPVLRQAGFECFGGFGNCTLPAHSTREIIAALWNTSDVLAAATVSGLYMIDVSVTACPPSGSCVETVGSQLTVRITLSNLETNDDNNIRE